MNQIHFRALALGLSLTLLLSAAEFGTVPDPFTGNWAGTLTAASRTEPVHATVVAGKGQFDVTFRATADPRGPAIIALPAKVRENRLVLELPAATDQASRWQGHAEGHTLSGTVTGPAAGNFSLQTKPPMPG
jgi:hypothetical protein